MKNQDIRNAAKQHGVRLWMVADALGVQDSALSKKLRRELPPAEKKSIFGIIEQLSKEGA